MPDLSIEHMQRCKNQKCQDPKYLSQGGCWPYLKSKKGFEVGTCKHVCQWNEQWSPERQTAEQKEKRVCPKCGNSTEFVRAAV